MGSEKVKRRLIKFCTSPKMKRKNRQRFTCAGHFNTDQGGIRQDRIGDGYGGDGSRSRGILGRNSRKKKTKTAAAGERGSIQGSAKKRNAYWARCRIRWRREGDLGANSRRMKRVNCRSGRRTGARGLEMRQARGAGGGGCCTCGPKRGVRGPVGAKFR